MKRKIQPLILITVLVWSISVYAEEISVEFSGDSVIVWNTGVEEQCAARFGFDVSQHNDTLTIVEYDSAGIFADCICLFDLAVIFNDLLPGDYTVMVYRGYFSEYGYGTDTTVFIGSEDFSYPDSVSTNRYLAESHSDCLRSTEDSTGSYWIQVNGNHLLFGWDGAWLNCCMIPSWTAVLHDDTLNITFEDTTGNPCFCTCIFDLTAEFGPFLPGAYVIMFNQPGFAPMNFVIEGDNVLPSDLSISTYQSSCYGIESVNTGGGVVPDHYIVLENYPNPFNAMTTVNVAVSTEEVYSVFIYDITGRLVDTLFRGVLKPGDHTFRWIPAGLSSGVYYGVAAGENRSATVKMVYLK